jgi:hypothetical protein
MNYAKVENGQIMQIGLPATGTLMNGNTVSGYNILPENVLIEEGWLPITDSPPVYDTSTQYLEHAGYTVGEAEVVVNYLVKQIVPVVAVPTTGERLAAVEEALLLLI